MSPASRTTPPPNVVVSTGYGRLHLGLTAREAEDRGLLHLAITGAYPTQRLRRCLELLGLAEKGRLARLLERDVGVSDAKLRPKLAGELVFELTQTILRIPLLRRLHPRAHLRVLRLYGWLAARELARRGGGATVFHFNAAYGGTSIDRARDLGMLTVCDHAIVHPEVIDDIVDNRGRLHLTPDGKLVASGPPQDAHWRAKLEDLARADAVIVNSEFVRHTFVAAGWRRERVHVAHLGVDEAFFRGLPTDVTRTPSAGSLRLLFAGRVERRKGVDLLFQTLAMLDDVDWELTLAGPIADDINAEHRSFLADRRVRKLGAVLRPQLRELMLTTPVFVFPSYAEGSARVIFEALACGCYVIATPNSGSIVEDGVHGAIVPPGDAAALSNAISQAERDRPRLAEIGTRNAKLVATQYRQTHYGNRLAEIWNELRPAPELTRDGSSSPTSRLQPA